MGRFLGISSDLEIIKCASKLGYGSSVVGIWSKFKWPLEALCFSLETFAR